MKERCPWCGEDPLYVRYHDEEWGVPVHDDRRHFEFLLLESMQAGLSWLLVLKKRENFRQAFAGFDPVKVAAFGAPQQEALLQNTGIIRNRLKIQAAIHNAARFLEVQQEFGSFDHFIWSYVENKPIVNHYKTVDQIPASTPLSDKLSHDLKKRGFKFMGSTVVYAHMQAIGMVNDHLVDCFTRQVSGA